MVPVNHLSIAPALRHFLPFPLLTVPIKEGQFGEGEREKNPAILWVSEREKKKKKKNHPKLNSSNRFRTLQTKRAGYAKIRPRRKGGLWERTDRNYFRSLEKSNQRTTPCPQNRIDRRLGSPSSTDLSNSLLGGTTQDCAPRMDVRHSGEPPRRPEVRRSRLWLHL
ncbi:unnamed protein product [Tuber melanosporum]|uniref:(Perigord truffle) hypothetical protein n=1 Tax=Tuber melanosporum (strain Mel28) TaxID=656061 RepID=D5GHL4_TUBMM|nr:uncharacterized protein GSTUM_00007973001 [Tuber melanosporum]CAZ84007.1 unnamed protein product [Tuber melanosporum]